MTDMKMIMMIRDTSLLLQYSDRDHILDRIHGTKPLQVQDG